MFNDKFKQLFLFKEKINETVFQINDVKKVNADLQLQVKINIHAKKAQIKKSFEKKSFKNFLGFLFLINCLLKIKLIKIKDFP